MPPEQPVSGGEDVAGITSEGVPVRFTDTSRWAEPITVGYVDSTSLMISDLAQQVRDLSAEVESLRSQVHALSVMVQQGQ